jgi:hypothetical protein
MARYLSGLCVASLGLCAGGWLIVTTILLSREATDAALVSVSTGAGLAVVSAVGIACWSVAWRQRMRRDGILGGVTCPVPAGRLVSAGHPVRAESPVPQSPVPQSPAPAGRAVPQGPVPQSPVPAGGPVPAVNARRRSSRVLRRDMRRAARAARRQQRRRGAASMGTIAYGASVARRDSAAQRSGAGQRAGVAAPSGPAQQQRTASPGGPAKPGGAGIEVILPPAVLPGDAALLLSEIKALLEPFLAVHDVDGPGAADKDKTTDKRPAPRDVPAPVRTPAVAPREPDPVPVAVPRQATPLIEETCPLVTGEGEESW